MSADVVGTVLANTTLAVAIVLFVFTAVILLPVLVGNLRWRRFTPSTTAHQVLGDSYASWTVDHALKAMILACERERLVVPGIVMVLTDARSIHLYLSSPAYRPPEPWTVSPDGITWTTSLAELQDAPVRASTVNTFTGLVTLGVSTNGRIFIDLSQANGLIGIGGDPGYRLSLARRWIDDFSSSPWSASTPIALLDLDELATERTVRVTGLPRLVGDVASGAAGVAILARSPKRHDAGALLAALESPGCRFPVISLGNSGYARWRFTAHADGWVTCDFLPPVKTGVTSLAPDSLAPASRAPAALESVG
ncbi:MAG: hypothetical protein JWQ43_1473 [Glaciihabitans sp.]|nr:hypothetical protein [Glaciihabitans sp.]